MKAKLSSASGSKAGTPPKPSAGGQQGAKAPGGAVAGGALAVPGANGPAPAGGAAPADQRTSLPPLTPEEMRRQYAGARRRAGSSTCAAKGQGAAGSRGTCTKRVQDRAGSTARRPHRSLHRPTCSPAPAADPLPLLRDVPPHEKQALFVRKLHLCAFSFDFTGASRGRCPASACQGAIGAAPASLLQLQPLGPRCTACTQLPSACAAAARAVDHASAAQPSMLPASAASSTQICETPAGNPSGESLKAGFSCRRRRRLPLQTRLRMCGRRR